MMDSYSPSEMCTVDGLRGVLLNKGTLAKIPNGTREHKLFFGKREAKIYKFEDKSMVTKFIKREINKEHAWEHRVILLRSKDPPSLMFFKDNL